MHNKFLWQSEAQTNVTGNLQPVTWRSNTFNGELTGGHSVMMSWLFTLYKCQQHLSFNSFTASNMYFFTYSFAWYIFLCVQELMCVCSSSWYLYLYILHSLSNNSTFFFSTFDLWWGGSIMKLYYRILNVFWWKDFILS